MHEPKFSNYDGSLESLEASLRSLPQPSVPPDLEQRLLAAIPGTAMTPARSWPIAEVMALAIAAGVMMAVAYSLAVHGRDKDRIANLKPAVDRVQVNTSLVDGSDQAIARRTAGSFADGLGPPRFVWPLAGISPPAVLSPRHVFSFD